MDDIHAEDQGDLQPAFFNGDFLDFPDLGDGFYIEETADLAFSDLFGDVGIAGLAGGDVAGGGEVELTDLFVEGHLVPD
jgi:hypothetical protein